MSPPRRQRRLKLPPLSAGWFLAREQALARRIRWPSRVFSLASLLVATPLVLAPLEPWTLLPHKASLAMGAFLLFVGLDYLAGLAGLRQGHSPAWEHALDRATDFPLLLVAAWLCRDLLPLPLLAAKVGLDALLLALLGRGRPRKRLRTGMGYTTLLALLILSQGWAPRLATPEAVTYLLWANVALSAVVALHQLGLLHARMLADALSAANLLCGVFAIIFASRGKIEISLLFVMLGTAFDGFDGAAARRFGSSRWGVYSDDVADAVNHGLAPAFSLYFTLGGVEGAVLGAFYALFTLGRLAFFTLNKAYADPTFFAGLPSPAGGVATLSALVLFRDYPAIVGLAVGIACIWMVSFDTQYRHIGRSLARHRHAIYGMPLLLLLLVIGFLLWGKTVPVSIIFGMILVYGFAPVVLHFRRVLRLRAARRAGQGEPA